MSHLEIRFSDYREGGRDEEQLPSWKGLAGAQTMPSAYRGEREGPVEFPIGLRIKTMSLDKPCHNAVLWPCMTQPHRRHRWDDDVITGPGHQDVHGPQLPAPPITSSLSFMWGRSAGTMTPCYPHLGRGGRSQVLGRAEGLMDPQTACQPALRGLGWASPWPVMN